MGSTYGTNYTSLGTTYNVNMDRPTVRVVTGRGTHTTVENRRGSMACMTVAVGRLLLGKVQVPYNGVQEFGLFDLTAGGLKIIELLSKDFFHGQVSLQSIVKIVLLIYVLCYRHKFNDLLLILKLSI